jgi:Na+/H+ antiporter NhaD/arsenite permease-like protein
MKHHIVTFQSVCQYFIPWISKTLILSSDTTYWLTVVFFSVTYIGLSLGKIPGLRIDRAGIALVGATLMIVSGILPLSEAVRSVDYETIILLFGMMVVVAHLRLSGAFDRMVHVTLGRVRTPHKFLTVTIVLSGVLSAFLVNDVVCLAMTPLVIEAARRLRIDPIPHLIGLATAANIGSTATLTGNPQNMIIGTLSHIPYGHFTACLAPVALVGLVLDYLVIVVAYRKKLAPLPEEPVAFLLKLAERRKSIPDPSTPWLIWKSAGIILTIIVLFFAGLPVPLVSLGAAALLFLGRQRPEKVYSHIDWSLLLMFCCLFIVVHAFEARVVHHWRIEHWNLLLKNPLNVLSLVSVALSNLVSNVPAVLLFKPVMPMIPASTRESAWLALAMSSTLAGNLTILGSVANLIVVGIALLEGVTVTLWDYCKVGIAVTILTLAWGITWMHIVY